MTTVPNRFHALLLRAYGRLPRGVRRVLVRTFAPSFNVGAMCVIQRHDGSLLLVRQSYRDGWGAPGGLLRRKEAPAAAALREAQEEVGVTIALDGEPTVTIDAKARRVDVVYRCHITPPEPDVVKPNSAEIVEARWFPPDSLPPLQRELAEALRRIGVLKNSPR